MSKDEKRKFIRQVNSEVTNFKNWDWVLARLGLKTITPNDDEALIRKGGLRGYGGESEAHKQLKEYIAAHPKTVGANEVGTTEHILLSADRLDVWFPKSRIAVEVKPKSAVDADILRGLFQCIKYKAVLDAESAVHGELADSKVILVMEGSLSPSNIEIMQTLGVDVIQNFKHKA